MSNNIVVTPELLNNISALSELGNTIDQAAVLLQVTSPDLAALLRDNAEARARWERGATESVNDLIVNLKKQSLQGSVQASKLLIDYYQAKSEKAAPLSSATSTAPTQMDTLAAPLNTWLPVPEVAKLIGVTAHGIRRRLKNPIGPALETKEIGGKTCVSSFLAYENFDGHGRRPDTLRQPPGYDEWRNGPRPAAIESFDPMIDPQIRAALGNLNPMDMEPHELAHRLLLASKIDPAKVRLTIMWSDSHQRRKTAELKAAAMLDTAAVRKLIRAHADVIKEEADARDKSFAEEMLRFIASNFPGVDLARVRPDALALLTCFYREDINRLFERLEAVVKEQLGKVRELEFTATEGAVGAACSQGNGDSERLSV